MYGKETITPNMHMSCHLRQCIYDYGPLHSFWAFPFERFNGILGNLPNNNKSIEVQMMKRFLSDQLSLSLSLPSEFVDDFEPLLSLERSPVGSLADTYSVSDLSKFTHTTSYDWSIESPQLTVSLPTNYSREVFNTTQVELLSQLYSLLYAKPSSEVEANSAFHKYSVATVKWQSIVFVEWNLRRFGNTLQIPGESEKDFESRPVRVNYFAKHSAVISGKLSTHLLASVSWYKYHPEHDACGKPVSVWQSDAFEVQGIHSLIPVQCIQCQTISLVATLNDLCGSVLFVSPLRVSITYVTVVCT